MSDPGRRKMWGNPCRRGHINEAGQTLRYVRADRAAGNCTECAVAHREASLAKRRARYASDPEFREMERARARTRAKVRSASGATRAQIKGLTLAQLQALYADQDAACAACGAPEPPGARGSALLHIDHDHACCRGGKSCGECTRGLLCQGCNQALGQLGDSLERIDALRRYLERHVRDNDSKRSVA